MSNPLTFSPDNARGEKVYSPMQQYILDNVITKHGGNAMEAAIAAGYVKPREAVKALKDELIELAREVLAESALPASLALKHIVTTDEMVPNIKERISAAKEILEQTNPKTTKVETSGEPIGIFILPPKKEMTDGE